MNQGNPVPGLQIELSTDSKDADQESKTVSVRMTDAGGRATFSAVAPGPYFVGIKHAAYSSSEEVLVSRSKSSSETIVLDWPGVKPLSARSVSGLLDAQVKTDRPLDDQAHPVYGPVEGWKLTLSKAVSGELIESQEATESGAFNFRPLTPGLYFLRVESPENERSHYRTDGFVPIEIDPSASASTLNLVIFQAICGSIGYENRQELMQ